MKHSSAFYQIVYEHDSFTQTGPGFLTLEEAVEHARTMRHCHPSIGVMIAFPKEQVDGPKKTFSKPAELPIKKTTIERPAVNAVGGQGYETCGLAAEDTCPYGNSSDPQVGEILSEIIARSAVAEESKKAGSA